MTENYFRRPLRLDAWVCVQLAVVLCCLTFSVFWGTRFSNSDDMFFSVSSFNSISDYIQFAARDALETGRFGVWYTSIYWLISAKFWDTPVYDIALFGSLAGVLVALLVCAHRFGQLAFALMVVTLYLACIEGSFQFNLLLSYPFRYNIGILIFLAALMCFEWRIRSGSRFSLLCGCLLSFIAFTHHETLFAVFAAVGLLFVVWRQPSGTILQRCCERDVLAFAATIMAYVAIYLAWRIMHPPTYAGTDLHVGAGFISGYLTALSYYLLASLPLFHSLYGVSLVFIDGATGQYASMSTAMDPISILGEIGVRDVIRAIAIAIAFMYAFRRLGPELSGSALLGIALAGLCIFLLPAAIISVSPTYHIYVQRGYAPLHPTFFSYFGAVILIGCGIAWLLLKLPSRPRWLAAVTLTFAIIGCSLIADAHNTQIARTLQINTQRWSVAALLMRHWEGFSHASMPEHLVAPQLWNYAGDVGPLPADYWSRLFKQRDLILSVTDKEIPNDTSRQAEVYYDCPAPDDCLVLVNRRWDGIIDIVSTSSRPRFLTSSGPDQQKTYKIVLTSERPPTLLRRGAFAATLHDPDIVFATLRPIM